MIKQRITVAKNKWDILIYYGTDGRDYEDVLDTLLELGCSRSSAKKAAHTVTSTLNTGLTFSNTDYMLSFVCISDTTSASLMISTIVHELKHVLSHICEYYGVDESGEDAAYLIGYIARRVYKTLSKFIWNGRF